MVKQLLSLRGVEYVEKNVSTDLEGRGELIAMGFDTTPVTVIGDRIVDGFNVAKIDEALKSLQ